ncbi:hypothetical protein GGX14DRAFT_347331 [Mycena pura]|uniref:Uncharacterized protein n=1 Tax=Mycena pura TaxID=153505 RepID=A0AAD7E3L1_9AGAR|nr:hypothetical protein GGX14DRAFT_347331 [Mycena pura]
MATGTHDQANAEIILALSKMGIYMERDREKLDTLSPSAQNTRLRKALDRAVDNCCIFQLLFTKEHREMRKLFLSASPEWEGWRETMTAAPFRSLCVFHFVDRPNSFGILLLKQTGIVGTTGVLSSLGIFEAVVNIIKKSNKKDKAEAAYFWATRKGDCIEVDLEDLPDQILGW